MLVLICLLFGPGSARGASASAAFCSDHVSFLLLYGRTVDADQVGRLNLRGVGKWVLMDIYVFKYICLYCIL